jgi:hypothetical protein
MTILGFQISTSTGSERFLTQPLKTSCCSKKISAFADAVRARMNSPITRAIIRLAGMALTPKRFLLRPFKKRETSLFCFREN